MSEKEQPPENLFEARDKKPAFSCPTCGAGFHRFDNAAFHAWHCQQNAAKGEVTPSRPLIIGGTP